MLCVIAKLPEDASEKLRMLRDSALPAERAGVPLYGHITIATFLPEDDGTPFEYGQASLDSRTLFAKPKGYAMQRTEQINDAEVCYDVECRRADSARIIGEQTYRGVRYRLSANTDKNNYPRVSVRLILGNMSYELSAHYTSDELDEAQMQSINEKAAERLEIYTKQIIDQYLQRSGS